MSESYDPRYFPAMAGAHGPFHGQAQPPPNVGPPHMRSDVTPAEAMRMYHHHQHQQQQLQLHHQQQQQQQNQQQQQQQQQHMHQSQPRSFPNPGYQPPMSAGHAHHSGSRPMGVVSMAMSQANLPAHLNPGLDGRRTSPGVPPMMSRLPPGLEMLRSSEFRNSTPTTTSSASGPISTSAGPRLPPGISMSRPGPSSNARQRAPPPLRPAPSAAKMLNNLPKGLSIGRPQASGTTAPMDRLSQLGGISMRPVGSTPPDRPAPSPPVRHVPQPTSSPAEGPRQNGSVSRSAAPNANLNLEHLKKLNLVVKAPSQLASPDAANAQGSQPVQASPSMASSSSNSSDQVASGVRNYLPEIKESRNEEVGFDLSKVKMEPGTETTNHFAAAYIKQRAAQMRLENSARDSSPDSAPPTRKSHNTDLKPSSSFDENMVKGKSDIKEPPISEPTQTQNEGFNMSSNVSGSPNSKKSESSTNVKDSDNSNVKTKTEEDDKKQEDSTSTIDQKAPNSQDPSNAYKSANEDAPKCSPKDDDEPKNSSNENNPESLATENQPKSTAHEKSDDVETHKNDKTESDLNPIGPKDDTPDEKSPNLNDEAKAQIGTESSEPIDDLGEPNEEAFDDADEKEMDDNELGNLDVDSNMEYQDEDDTDHDAVDDDGAPVAKSESTELIRRESVNSDEVQSPFKKPSDFGFNESGSVSGRSQGGNRVRHRSMESSSDYSESGKSVMDSQQQYQNHLAFCKKPLVGQETICIICLTRCCDKQPKLLTCLHSTCHACFQNALDDARKEHKTVENVTLDDDIAPIEQDVFILCPLCKVSTSETELSDNLFLEPDGEGDSIGIQICESCDEANPADSRCQDCEENLCSDCVKAHQRVKMTKDHRLIKVAVPKRRKASALLAPKDFFCTFHPTDRRTIFCDSCEALICNECKNAGPHKDHTTRSSFEAAPDVKEQLTQQISDIRLKRNTLDENRSLLGAKLNELGIKEKSLRNTITEVKDYLLARIEARFRGLTNELGRGIREKRKAIEARKTTLDRFHVQTDYAIAFVDNALLHGDEDDAILVAKRALERQLRRLKKVDPSTGLSDNTREFKLDLYFQHFSGPQLHTSLESVLKQVMQDIKILSAPPAIPETKPNIPTVPQTSPLVNQPHPGSNLGGLKITNSNMSPQARLMANLSNRSPNVTPTKSPMVARGRMPSPMASRGRGVVSRGRSPIRGGAVASPRGRAVIANRGAARGVVSGRGATGRGSVPVRGSPRGGASVVRGNGRGRVATSTRGSASARGQAVANRGSRGRGTVTSVRGATSGNCNSSTSRGAIGAGVVITPNISKATNPGQVAGSSTKRIMSLPPGTIAVPASSSTSNSSSSGKGAASTMSLEQQRKLELVRQQQEQKQKQLQMQQLQQKQQQQQQQPQISTGQPQTDDRYFKAAYGRSNGGVPNGSSHGPNMPPTNGSLNSIQNYQQQMQFQQHQQIQRQQQLQKQQQQQQHMQQQNRHLVGQQQFQQRPSMPSQYVQHPNMQVVSRQQQFMMSSQGHPPHSNANQSQYNNVAPQASIQSFTHGPGQESQIVPPPTPVSSSSWHMPSPQIGTGVSITPSSLASPTVENASPSKPSVDNSFKIKLPGMNRRPSNSTEMKTENTVIEINDEDATTTTHNAQVANKGSKNVITLEQTDRRKKAKSHDELPDLSSLLSDDEELSGSPADWVNKENADDEPVEQDPLSLDGNAVGNAGDEQEGNIGQALPENDPEPESPGGEDLGSFSEPVPIKIELSLNSKSQGKRLSRSAAKADAEMKKEVQSTAATDDQEGNGDEDGKDEEWCAVCHDGGDILYCCDRCPKVYHLYCYIPPLTSEPPDDWVCLMCATKDEIQQFPNKKDDQSGKLGNRDLKICRRILFEMFNQYPQSMPFRDCSDLNFPEYLEVVKKPIALDIIKEKLSADNPEQYASKELFLKDLRRIFRNCYSFHERDSEFHQHARELEEYLDRQLETWLPELAYDETLSEIVDCSKGKKKKREREYSPSDKESSSKKRKKSESDGSDSPKKKKKKKKRKDESDDDSMSEGEKLDYLDALEASLHDKKTTQSKRANSNSKDHPKKLDENAKAKDVKPQIEEEQTDEPQESSVGKGKGKGKRSSTRIRR